MSPPPSDLPAGGSAAAALVSARLHLRIPSELVAARRALFAEAGAHAHHLGDLRRAAKEELRRRLADVGAVLEQPHVRGAHVRASHLEAILSRVRADRTTILGEPSHLPERSVPRKLDHENPLDPTGRPSSRVGLATRRQLWYLEGAWIGWLSHVGPSRIWASEQRLTPRPRRPERASRTAGTPRDMRERPARTEFHALVAPSA